MTTFINFALAPVQTHLESHFARVLVILVIPGHSWADSRDAAGSPAARHRLRLPPPTSVSSVIIGVFYPRLSNLSHLCHFRGFLHPGRTLEEA